MRYIHIEHISNSKPDPYQELAIGVIRQAADDYRYLSHRLSTDLTALDRKKIKGEMKSIRRFFLGKWCSILSGSEQSGPLILNLLDAEVLEHD